MVTFGEALSILRKTYCYTQREVGTAIGVSDRTISDWEQGKKPPTIKHLSSIERLFFPYRDILRDLLSEPNSKNLRRKQRYDVIFRLWNQTENQLNEYIKQSYVNSEDAIELFGIEKTNYQETDHIIIGELIKCVRKMLGQSLVTLEGEFSNLFFASILGVTQFNNLETKYICPSCKTEKVLFCESGYFARTCKKCGIPMVNVSQSCALLSCYKLFNEYLAAPYDVTISVPSNVFGKVCNIAMSYFSLMMSAQKEVRLCNGQKCVEIHLYHDEDETKSRSLTGGISDSGNYCFTLRIFASKKNQHISDMLKDSKPELAEIYSKDNIQSLAKNLKNRLPEKLQNDANYIERIDQLINLLILIENIGLVSEDKISQEVLEELQKKMAIARWPDVPLTEEDYGHWIEKNEQFWKNHKVEELGFTDEEGFKHFYCGKYHKGLYCEKIYRELLANLFGICGDE